MNNNTLLAVFSGVGFALWPLAMNRSGLGGFTSLVFLSIVMLVGSVPFALRSGISLSGVSWSFACTSAVIGLMASLCFNTMLANATKDDVKTLFLITIMVQTAFVAFCKIAGNNWTITWQQAVGLPLAFITIYLLTR